VTESWLSKNVPSDPFNIPGFFPPLRKDRSDRRGGGILLYIRDDFASNIKRHTYLEEQELESMWFTIRPFKLPRERSLIILGVIYHPPKPNPDRPMQQHIYSCLDTLLAKHPDAAVILLGDFNTLDDCYLKRGYRLQQIVCTPTKGASILDKVYTNVSHWYSKPQVLPPLGSLPHGHGVVICPPSAGVQETVVKKELRLVRKNDQNAQSMFAHALKNIRWENL
jgi:hypothetical protein